MLYLYVSHLGNREFVDGTLLLKLESEIAAWQSFCGAIAAL